MDRRMDMSGEVISMPILEALIILGTLLSMVTSGLPKLIRLSAHLLTSELQAEPTSTSDRSIQKPLSEHDEESRMIRQAIFPSYEERVVLPTSQGIWVSERRHHERSSMSPGQPRLLIHSLLPIPPESSTF